MKNNFLFRGLQIDQDIQEELDKRISSKINIEVEFAREPIEYNRDLEAYKVSIEGVVSQGLYETKQQAILAIAIYSVQPDIIYQELYNLSKFIVQGLQ